jgi:hypothetical protein
VTDTLLVCVGQSVDFAKFQAEKYDFDLYKGLFVETLALIRQISKKQKSKLLGFYDRFH